ncbi:hypothetical protein [Agrococcus jejuensis]|nr:hypothetical protein [Agrococcus jejuensis]
MRKRLLTMVVTALVPVVINFIVDKVQSRQQQQGGSSKRRGKR